MDFRFAGIIVGLLVTASVAPALSHAGAMGVTKERMDAMTDMGRALKQLHQHMRAGDLMQAADVTALINELKQKGHGIKPAFAVEEIPAMSEASPAIWEDSEGFEKAISMFNADVASLLAAYENSDAAQTQAALKAVSTGCTACHDDYRIEK